MEHSQYTICIVQPGNYSPSETFLKAHEHGLPGKVIVIHGGVPMVGERPIKSQSMICRACRKAIRISRRQGWEAELTSAYLRAFRRYRPDVVLAEYGGTGVDAMAACKKAGIPLVVHFHGYDASLHVHLEQMERAYPLLFQNAAAIVAVSRAMRSKLIALGAPPEKVHWNVYGVECDKFRGADPANVAPEFLAVGRFTEKKAPHLTLLAFAEVRKRIPQARLRMIGFGPLLSSCIDLAKGLGIADAVTFLGACAPEQVQDEMRRARCFVQHSVEATSGDSEGTPVAILEAGASGLPVVSTRHAGIPDVVIDGQTGFLVEERDVKGMAERMTLLAKDPATAGKMGRAAREWVQANFSMQRSIGRLCKIMESCIPDKRCVLPSHQEVSVLEG